MVLVPSALQSANDVGVKDAGAASEEAFVQVEDTGHGGLLDKWGSPLCASHASERANEYLRERYEYAKAALNRRNSRELRADTVSFDVSSDMETLYRTHYSWALKVATRVVGPDDAEDIVSDVFLSVLTARRNGKGPSDNERAYLKRAIQNAATRVYARRRALQTVEPPTVAVDTTGPVERALDRAQVLRNAPDRWGAVLYLADVAGYSNAEVADLTGMTLSAAVSVLRRAREALRDDARARAAPRAS